MPMLLATAESGKRAPRRSRHPIRAVIWGKLLQGRTGPAAVRRSRERVAIQPPSLGLFFHITLHLQYGGTRLHRLPFPVLFVLSPCFLGLLLFDSACLLACPNAHLRLLINFPPFVTSFASAPGAIVCQLTLYSIPTMAEIATLTPDHPTPTKEDLPDAEQEATPPKPHSPTAAKSSATGPARRGLTTSTAPPKRGIPS